MKKKVKLLLYTVMSWIIIHSMLISIDGLTDDYQASEVAIVLGSKVNEDGKPSKRLKARLDMAIELFNQSMVRFIIVSGGYGKEGYEEAEVMRNYLINKNIPDSLIIEDRKGNNTYLSAINFAIINTSYQFDSVILVSQFFHLSRSKLIFKKLGIKKITTAHAKYFEWRDIFSLLREFPAYYKYLFY